MSTNAVFFVGKGKKAVGLGCHSFDGYPYWEYNDTGGVPKSIINARTEESFRKEVIAYLCKIEDDRQIRPRGPLTWASSGGFRYVYAFFNGRCWISAMGSSWYNLLAREKRLREAPTYPLLRKGKIDLEGSISISCGDCRKHQHIKLKSFLRVRYNPFEGVVLRNNEGFRPGYFGPRGWVFTKSFGWLCTKCKSFHES